MAICGTWFSLGTVGKSISLFLGHPVIENEVMENEIKNEIKVKQNIVSTLQL